MASKTTSGKAWHNFKAATDGLQSDTTFSDLQRSGIQQAAIDLYKALNGDAFAGKTATLTADVFSSATTPSISVSLAFT